MSVLIGSNDRLFVLTGAGISAESGIPTFRDQDGLWQGHRVEDVATPQGFRRDPQLVWQFYSARRAQAASCLPNPAHIALAKLEERLGNRMLICTQNIDRLHEMAGSNRVLHMHGMLFQSCCSNPNCATEPFEDTRSYRRRSDIPACPQCGALIRPHVCWFNEIPFHMDEVLRAINASTVFVTVGSSGVVEPAASFPLIARQHAAKAFYVGLETPANGFAFDQIILGPAGEQLPKLFTTE